MNNLAQVYKGAGKNADAEALLTDTLAIRRRISGPEHPDTLLAISNLGIVYVNEGKYREAEALLAGAPQISQRVLGKDHPQTLELMEHLAQLWEHEGKYSQAVALYEAELDSRRRLSGKDHPFALNVEYYLGRVRFRQGKYSAAEAILRSTVAAFRNTKSDSPNAWSRYGCESLLGMTLAAQQHYAAAEPFLLSGYEGMHQRAAVVPHSYLADAQKALVRLYEDWGKPEKATQWRNR